MFGKNEVSLKPTDLDYSQIVKTQAGIESNTFELTATKIDSLAKAFKSIGEIDFNTIAFQMRNKMPMTIRNLKTSSVLFEE